MILQHRSLDGPMPQRIDQSWTVIESVENSDHDSDHDSDHNCCVDFHSCPDGTFGNEECRRQPEDEVRWTGASYYSAFSGDTEGETKQFVLRTVV